MHSLAGRPFSVARYITVGCEESSSKCKQGLHMQCKRQIEGRVSVGHGQDKQALALTVKFVSASIMRALIVVSANARGNFASLGFCSGTVHGIQDAQLLIHG